MMAHTLTQGTPAGTVAVPLAEDRKAAMTGTLQWLLDEVVAETMIATQDQAPGLERVWTGIQTHLDACLRRPAIRVLSSALHGNPEAEHIKRRCISGMAMIFQVEFNSIGLPLAAAHARTMNALVMDAQAAEHEARRPLPEFRQTLQNHLRSLHA